MIEVKNLEKIYGEGDARTTALDGVTFDIKKGEFVAIMGASGSGKSTLLHVLGFLDKHTGGEYYFEGKKIESYTEDDLAKLRNNKMGFVFQAFNLLPRTTVLENVKLPLLYSDIPESKWDALAMEAIDSVGLMHRINHEPSQLSGGEKQRVAIARALILNPSVIFADEPTGNLDSKSGQIVMQTLQRLHEDHGNTIILITHETYTAEHATRIIKLHDGKIASDEAVKHRLKATQFIK
ncbi:TPA: macrolide ABC transporter ATP-binding protein [Candidatus Peregrinibacteria bacterium]|nr:macrolide ABC transporter ATP-binding protein [Candidatus Peregrinibacteria bacterium]